MDSTGLTFSHLAAAGLSAVASTVFDQTDQEMKARALFFALDHHGSLRAIRL